MAALHRHNIWIQLPHPNIQHTTPAPRHQCRRRAGVQTRMDTRFSVSTLRTGAPWIPRVAAAGQWRLDRARGGACDGGGRVSDAGTGGWVRGGKMLHGIVFPHRKGRKERKGNVTVSLRPLRSLRCSIWIKLYFYSHGGTPPAQQLSATTPTQHPAHAGTSAGKRQESDSLLIDRFLIDLMHVVFRNAKGNIDISSFFEIEYGWHWFDGFPRILYYP